MSKLLIPEELQALIDQYLTDGVLTDKERQVILRKAEGMGLDRDEIDLYLDAEVQKIDQATDAAVRKQKGKTCPYCGGSVPQLTDKCPHCGQNITPEASSELQEIFDNLEEALVQLKSGKDIHTSKATVERFARKAKMYYGNNPKVQKLLSEIETETIDAENMAKANARKSAVIQFLLNHKVLIFQAIVILAIFLGIKSCIDSNDRKEKETEELYNQQYELDKPKIDNQYDSLCKCLDELETPNKSNFKEMTRKLQNIVWNDISKSTVIERVIMRNKYIDNQYEYNKKEAYLEKKRAYAEQLKTVYKKVYGDDEYYDNTPDEIRHPSNIRQ